MSSSAQLPAKATEQNEASAVLIQKNFRRFTQVKKYKKDCQVLSELQTKYGGFWHSNLASHALHSQPQSQGHTQLHTKEDIEHKYLLTAIKFSTAEQNLGKMKCDSSANTAAIGMEPQTEEKPEEVEKKIQVCSAIGGSNEGKSREKPERKCKKNQKWEKSRNSEKPERTENGTGKTNSKAAVREDTPAVHMYINKCLANTPAEDSQMKREGGQSPSYQQAETKAITIEEEREGVFYYSNRRGVAHPVLLMDKGTLPQDAEFLQELAWGRTKMLMDIERTRASEEQEARERAKRREHEKWKREAMYLKNRDDYLKSRMSAASEMENYKSPFSAQGLQSPGLQSHSFVSRIDTIVEMPDMQRIYSGLDDVDCNREAMYLKKRDEYLKIRMSAAVEMENYKNPVLVQGLQTPGLQSNSFASRAGTIVEMPDMQRIYSGLDEAESIIERLYNKNLMPPSISDADEARQRINEIGQVKTDVVTPMSIHTHDQQLLHDGFGPTVSQQHALALARHVRLSITAHFGGCVGWFLERDNAGTGLVAVKDIISDLTRPPFHFTESDALHFVDRLWNVIDTVDAHSDIFHRSNKPRANLSSPRQLKPQRIPLSALWIALHCPNVGQVDRCSLSRPSRPGAPHRMAGHVLYGGRGARPGEDAQQVQQKRYEHLMPNMKCEQFIKEVLDISRTAAGELAAVCARQKHLQQRIRLEARLLQAQGTSLPDLSQFIDSWPRDSMNAKPYRVTSKTPAKKTHPKPYL